MGAEADRRAGHGRGERLREELRDYAIVSAYLYVCLSALLFYKFAVLREVGLGVLPFATAAIKALVLGKFALLGKAAGLSSRIMAPTVWQRILRQSLAFVVLLIALTVLEEFVAGWIHGESFTQTLAEHGAHVMIEIAANAVILLFVVGAFIAVMEIAKALGPGGLLRILRSPPP